ncbi:MAG: XTP/dITP diphosphatase [Acidaminobacteraceae bacterium]
MNRMILASGNAHKLEEIMEITKEFGIELVSMSDAGLVDFDIEENGDTFEENSMIKAKAVVDKLGEATIADDSGLMVDYLDGAPGIYSARYSGEDKNYDANNKKLLKELSGVPMEKRTARFVSVITLLTPEGRSLVVRGEIEGVISEGEIGGNGFGYDPLFYIPSKGKTFAELNSNEKNEISHRANALIKLKSELKEFLK